MNHEVNHDADEMSEQLAQLDEAAIAAEIRAVREEYAEEEAEVAEAETAQNAAAGTGDTDAFTAAGSRPTGATTQLTRVAS